MKTENIKIDFDTPLEEQLCAAAQIIKRGGLVAFPTETVYGLGADAFNSQAVENIFAAKGRPKDNPLIMHIADKEDFGKYHDVKDIETYNKIIEAFVPGPITIVAKKKDIVSGRITKGMSTVAVRLPQNPVARELIRLSKTPIAAPSANLSGSPSPTSARHVRDDLDGRIDMIIDGGECRVGLESTVILISDDVPAKISLLRPGGITLEMLCEIVGQVHVDPAVKGVLKDGEAPMAPGMKYRHYAPHAPLFAVEGEESRVVAFLKDKLADGCGIICFDEQLEFLKGENVITIGSVGSHEEQARKLFSALREFDKRQLAELYTVMPKDDKIGLAVVNRLLKACGHNIIKV